MNTDTMEKYLIERSAEKGLPISASMELSPLCNMNCDMCYVRLSREEIESRGRLLTLEEWKSIGEKLQKAGVMFLMITGGEPLLYPDFRELYLYLKSLGMVIAVNTNGTLLNERWIDFFRSNPPRRLNITLYGSSAETYGVLCHYPQGFEKAVSAIRTLRANGIDVKVNGTLVEANKDEYEALMTLAEELDCPINIDTHMQPATREREKAFDHQSRMDPKEAAQRFVEIRRREKTPEEFEEYVRSVLDAVKMRHDHSGEEIIPIGIKCQAARTSFVVNWQGMMRPCVMLPEPQEDVLHQDIMVCWEALREACGQIRLNEKCFGCEYRDVCGTCAACGLHEAGAWDALPEYLCRYTKEIVRLLAEEQNV